MGPSDAPTGGRILFVGDSITQQWSRHRPFFFADHGFLNRGIGGQTTRDIRARFGAELARAEPAGVHVMAGLNDIAGNGGPIPPAETQDNIAAMMADAKAAGCRVLVGSVTPAAVIAWNPSVRPAEPIRALNAWLRDHAAAEGATFVDYHAALRDEAGGLRRGIGRDGSHLDPRGYRIIEPVLLAAVAEMFGTAAFTAPAWGTRMLRALRLARRPPAAS